MTDEHYMLEALKEAQKASRAGEVPIGAVLVQQERIIARGYNQVETLSDSTAHAEMIALTSAFNFLGSKYLPEARLYVTVQPCLMCSGALYWSKIAGVVYGAHDEKNGYSRVAGNNSPFHPKTIVKGGVLQEDCLQLIKNFFKSKR